MLLAEAGCVFMGFMLCFSGVQGRANSICALKGSSVDLPCSAEHPTTTMKWYTVQQIGSVFNLKNLTADDSHVKYMLEENNFNLTIKALTERDAKLYCCSSKEDAGKPRNSQQGMIKLRVADLQVKVIPSTEGHTVTLMCSTSCPLTENPAAYIWYKNREFLYEDWSPWYQQLVSSEEAVTYSCAIKGYEDLRAPQVSVDSVTSACFSVTYAKGRMCSYKKTSVDEPCSITYPTGVYVQKTRAAATGHVRLTCNTSCPQTDLQSALKMYRSSVSEGQYGAIKDVVPQTSTESFSCAVNGLKDLHSAAVCAEEKKCWTVNYVSRRICAVQGSSVNISSEYSHPDYEQPQSKSWYKIIRGAKKDTEKPVEVAGHVEYHENMNNHHILSIKNLTKNDSTEYKFKIQTRDGWKQSDFSGVTLVVTGLKVTFTPSAVVTEGQRVTLTCSTSCPLNTNYTWNFNSRPLNLPENQNKHLILDPVSSQHEGRYSCTVKTGRRTIGSSEKTLTVQNTKVKQTSAAAAGVGAALLVLILLAVFCWIRKKKTPSQSPQSENSNNLEQLNPGPVYDEISAQPTEQDDHHYSSVLFHQKHTDPVYSTVQPHQAREQEHIPYAVVHFESNKAP
ncbi:B-cell receptor CD22-like [Acanthopagrus latus]|uniref:B-cell receptor CD22-like n=1 Tax=Acanthopagrus latus TaxID=8177 RepID=UPI00187CCA3C|nr:B-cell receptor CD22-like [Acanthopagrus latus]